MGYRILLGKGGEISNTNNLNFFIYGKFDIIKTELQKAAIKEVFLSALFITKTTYKIPFYKTLTKGLVLGSCVSTCDPASRAPKLEFLQTW